MRRISRLALALTATVLLALGLAACGDDSSSASSDPIVIGYSAWPGWFPLKVAEAQGFFADAGVNVELKYFNDYTASIDALAAGQVDANAQTLNDTLAIAATGSDVRIVVNTDFSAGNDAIIVDRSITSVADLKGKTVAAEAGVVDDNPARSIRMHRLPRKLPVFLTTAEKKRLLKELKGRTDFSALRDRAMIEVLLGTGIRLGELAALDMDDIDLDAKHLRVRAKGNVPQVKFIKTDLRTLLRRYLAERRRHGRPEMEALFLSNRDGRLCQRQIANRLAHWLRKAGIEKELTPHGLRHTFATHLYGATNDLLVVQRALGHRDVSTTQIYTHLVDGQLEEALERL